MRVLVGILLMFVGFIALFAVIVIPVLPSTEDSVTVNNYLTPLLCNPGEKLIREQYQTRDSDGTGYSMTPYCVNSERHREDVTGKWVLIGAGGFLAPFLIGLLVTIVSASAAARRRTGQLLNAYPNSYGGTDFAIFNASGSNTKNIGFSDGTLKVNGFEIKLDGLTQEKIDAMKSQMQATAGGGDLTAKLHQLQEAKDKGLISSDEYDRLRQRILDDMG
jgi:hypothetical protein